MILKEKMFLSNCDSVRGLAPTELRKRLLLGAVWSEGVIVSPNLLIDNAGIAGVLDDDGLRAWYRDEGRGSLVLRGPFADLGLSLVDYFRALPGSHVLSRCGGRCKAALTPAETDTILRDLDRIDRLLAEHGALIEPFTLAHDALSREIVARLEQEPGTRAALTAAGLGPDEMAGLTSRSAWYARLAEALPDPDQAARFRLGVVDAAYNALFVRRGEAFVMDRIAVLHGLPPALLDASVRLRALRREIGQVQAAVKLISLVGSLGTDGLVKVLTDQALDYVQDKAQDKGIGWLDRRNWFGLYPQLRNRIGVEVRR